MIKYDCSVGGVHTHDSGENTFARCNVEYPTSWSFYCLPEGGRITGGLECTLLSWMGFLYLAKLSSHPLEASFQLCQMMTWFSEEEVWYLHYEIKSEFVFCENQNIYLVFINTERYEVIKVVECNDPSCCIC